VPGGMLETAQNIRARYKIDGQQQNVLRARLAPARGRGSTGGRFAAEIVPVAVTNPQGEGWIDTDEHPRPDTTLERLNAMRPLMEGEIEGATVTAGNASGQNDGASLCIVTTPDPLRPSRALKNAAEDPVMSINAPRLICTHASTNPRPASTCFSPVQIPSRRSPKARNSTDAGE